MCVARTAARRRRQMRLDRRYRKRDTSLQQARRARQAAKAAAEGRTFGYTKK